jgi:tRNA-specific 2-thiouridylase
MRVVVAMSGGVDSSVTAALLHEAGHEVVGLSMRLRDAAPEERSGGGSCCSPDDLRDARAVCDTLGVPHYVVDYRDAFRKAVIEPFARAYLAGRTPNPCVLCNDHLKFAALLTRARALGADALATGHYARITAGPDGRLALRRAADRRKDQSYFLFGMDQKALGRTLFPLGDMDKDTVRDHARRFGLPNGDKPDSEDICFVPDGDYARVVEEVVGEVPGPGPIVDESGRVLGTHRGVHHFTVGQRKGLGVASEERLYVLSVDGPGGVITVGGADRLQVAGLRAERCHWVDAAPDPERVVDAQIRYRHEGAAARVRVEGDAARVTFLAPQRAVAPGQAVVLYDGDRVLGGGWIEAAEGEVGR